MWWALFKSWDAEQVFPFQRYQIDPLSHVVDSGRYEPLKYGDLT